MGAEWMIPELSEVDISRLCVCRYNISLYIHKYLTTTTVCVTDGLQVFLTMIMN